MGSELPPPGANNSNNNGNTTHEVVVLPAATAHVQDVALTQEWRPLTYHEGVSVLGHLENNSEGHTGADDAVVVVAAADREEPPLHALRSRLVRMHLDEQNGTETRRRRQRQGTTRSSSSASGPVPYAKSLIAVAIIYAVLACTEGKSFASLIVILLTCARLAMGLAACDTRPLRGTTQQSLGCCQWLVKECVGCFGAGMGAVAVWVAIAALTRINPLVITLACPPIALVLLHWAASGCLLGVWLMGLGHAVATILLLRFAADPYVHDPSTFIFLTLLAVCTLAHCLYRALCHKLPPPPPPVAADGAVQRYWRNVARLCRITRWAGLPILVLWVWTCVH